MALIKCPECQKSISDKANFCPHCGLPAAYFRSVGTTAAEPAQVDAPKSAPKAASPKKTKPQRKVDESLPRLHVYRETSFNDNKNEGLFKNAPDDLPLKIYQTLYELLADQENIVIDYELFDPKTGTTIKGTTGVDSEVIHGEPKPIPPESYRVEAKIVNNP